MMTTAPPPTPLTTNPPPTEATNTEKPQQPTTEELLEAMKEPKEPEQPNFDRAEAAQAEAHKDTSKHETVVREHEAEGEAPAAREAVKEEEKKEKEKEEVVAEQPLKRIVVIALDDSKNSNKAFEWALDNFLNPKTDLALLLNVRPPPVIPGPFGTAYMDYTEYIVQLDMKNRQDSHTLLQYYANLVHKRKIAVKAIAMRGDARDELCRKVEEVKADVLILGSRGQGAWRRAFLGSVSDHCVHHCQCPVIIIKDVEKKGKESGGKAEKQHGEGSGHTPAAQVMPSSIAH
ncbi:hypothetical protein HK097_003559 [Rhizophlyctis rosea]|uniref:UspA domain-containing protein n=1 Tax=Rhizophlyctis rosea TaxID=64517 RepID=A0AAD5WZZ9_9FUNG|nr:hypothetical protein HK097_003559 [Rhizophlyctis rosea]